MRDETRTEVLGARQRADEAIAEARQRSEEQITDARRQMRTEAARIGERLTNEQKEADRRAANASRDAHAAIQAAREGAELAVQRVRAEADSRVKAVERKVEQRLRTQQREITAERARLKEELALVTADARRHEMTITRAKGLAQSAVSDARSAADAIAPAGPGLGLPPPSSASYRTMPTALTGSGVVQRRLGTDQVARRSDPIASVRRAAEELAERLAMVAHEAEAPA